MKKLGILDYTKRLDLTQEKIMSLEDDLLTVLEGHMDELETGELFFVAFRYMTKMVYECAPTHREALKILRMGIDQAIQDFMEHKEKR